MSARIPDDVRLAVLDRDGWRCVNCGTNIIGKAASLHHRQGRRGKNPHRMSNLVSMCGTGTTGCHGWITVHPAAAYDTGLAVRRTGIQTTEDTPVRTWQGWVTLDNEGTTTPVRSSDAEQRV